RDRYSQQPCLASGAPAGTVGLSATAGVHPCVWQTPSASGRVFVAASGCGGRADASADESARASTSQHEVTGVVRVRGAKSFLRKFMESSLEKCRECSAISVEATGLRGR